VTNDLWSGDLGVEQLGECVIVASNVAVSTARSTWCATDLSAGRWEASIWLPYSTTQATSPRSKLAATRCSCTLVGPKINGARASGGEPHVWSRVPNLPSVRWPELVALLGGKGSVAGGEPAHAVEPPAADHE
jgi:hypothetical protein